MLQAGHQRPAAGGDAVDEGGQMDVHRGEAAGDLFGGEGAIAHDQRQGAEEVVHRFPVRADVQHDHLLSSGADGLGGISYPVHQARGVHRAEDAQHEGGVREAQAGAGLGAGDGDARDVGPDGQVDDRLAGKLLCIGFGPGFDREEQGIGEAAQGGELGPLPEGHDLELPGHPKRDKCFMGHDGDPDAGVSFFELCQHAGQVQVAAPFAVAEGIVLQQHPVRRVGSDGAGDVPDAARLVGGEDGLDGDSGDGVRVSLSGQHRDGRRVRQLRRQEGRVVANAVEPGGQGGGNDVYLQLWDGRNDVSPKV